VDWHDIQRWKLINDTLNLGLSEPVETYSTSAHLFTDLGIPQDARGTLPRAQRGRLGLDAEDLEDIGETGRSRSQIGSARKPGARDKRELSQRSQRVRHRTRAGAPAAGQGDQAAGDSRPAAAAGLRAADEAAARTGQPARRRRRPARGRSARGAGQQVIASRED